MMNTSITATADMDETFVQILQKHCGSNLFLAGIILYAAGNVLTMLIGYGLVGILPLLLLVLPTIGLLLVYFESKHNREPKNTLQVLKLTKIFTIIILVVLCVNIPFYINSMMHGGNIAALSGFYALIYSGPIIVYIVSLFRVARGLKQGIERNERSKLRGVILISIFGVINVILDFLQVGLFTASARDVIFHFIYLTQGILDFGLSAGIGFWFGLVSAAGAIIFIVLLNRFNRDLLKGKKSIDENSIV